MLATVGGSIAQNAISALVISTLVLPLSLHLNCLLEMIYRQPPMSETHLGHRSEGKLLWIDIHSPALG